MNPCIIPPKLNLGDTIEIIATARKISLQELTPTIKIIEDNGFKVSFGKNLFESENQFSGSDLQRARDLQEAINNPEVKAILCARGGYGTVRVIDKINYNALGVQPKWIIGYSDVTALHCHLQQTQNVASLHATMPINFEKNSVKALNSLFNVLKGEPNELSQKPHILQVNGTAEGKLVGGNLSVLYSLLGSKSFPDTSNCILFLEDLDEYLYHIDRMMQGLERARVFKNLKGVALGSFSDMRDNIIPFGKTAEEILISYFKPLNIPVAFNLPAGHLNDNQALVLGANAQLIVNDKMVSLKHGIA